MDRLLLLASVVGQPLHEISRVFGRHHDLGHRVAHLLGLETAYAYFCHLCPPTTLWEPED